jgi:hypothetical protein
VVTASARAIFSRGPLDATHFYATLRRGYGQGVSGWPSTNRIRVVRGSMGRHVRTRPLGARSHAIGLLDTLTVERLTARYRKEDLEVECGEAAR